MKKLFLLLTCLSFVSCGQLDDMLDKDGDAAGEENVSGGGDSSEDGDSESEAKMVVSGYVQKGQFAAGSQVTVFGLNEKMQATGNSWPSNVKDASGSFSITIEEGDPFMEVRAQGYYFDELTGDTSDGPMTLEAVVDASYSTANVNLLTHLVRPRIKNLMAEGYAYADAKTQAEGELVTTLGYSALDISFDQLDITKSREGDALLLALACALQHGRTTGEMVTFINELSLDFKEDGILEESNLAKIETAKSQIDIMQVYENMQEYYRKNNMKDAAVPDFYRYLLDEDTFVVQGMETEEKSSPHEGGEDELDVLSVTDFTAESDVDWIEVSKEHIVGPQYKISLKVLPNEPMDDRTGKIVFKDAQGGTRTEFCITQTGAYVLIECSLTSVFSPFQPPRSMIVDSDGYFNITGEDMVDVNGEDYSIVGARNSFTVRSRYASSYMVSYPADAVEAQPDGTYCINFPSEISNGTCGVIVGETEEALCRLASLNALIKFDFSNIPDWTHVEISVDEGVAICGEVVVSSDYNVISVKDGKSVVRVNRSGDESMAYIPVLPGEIEHLTCTVYYADGKSFSRTARNPISLRKNHVVPVGTFSPPQQ